MSHWHWTPDETGLDEDDVCPHCDEAACGGTCPGALMEAAAQECGLQDDGTCALAGTEGCDFRCPYRDQLAPEEDTP